MRPNRRDFITSNVKNECHPDTQSETASVSLHSVNFNCESVHQLDTITVAINKHVRWEVCRTDWNDSSCPRGKNITRKKYHTQGHTRVQAKASPAFCLLKQGISEQTWELSNLASFCAENQRPRPAGLQSESYRPLLTSICYEPSLSVTGIRKTREEMQSCAAKTQVPLLVEVLKTTDDTMLVEWCWSAGLWLLWSSTDPGGGGSSSSVIYLREDCHQ